MAPKQGSGGSMLGKASKSDAIEEENDLGVVVLREIDRHNMRSIVDLRVESKQAQFVAANAVSLAQAFLPQDQNEDEAWARGIFLNSTPIGFVLMSQNPKAGEYYLWRFMVDKRWQRRGYGKRAMELVKENVQQESQKVRVPVKKWSLSVIPENSGARSFYAGAGWEETGLITAEGEVEMVYGLCRHTFGIYS